MKNWIIKIKKGICVFMGILRKYIDLLGLIIAFVSLIIALIALKSVTKVEGFRDLLNATSQNTIKLNQMVSGLEKQNSLQQANIDSIKIELNELRKQTKILIDLQKSNSAQLSIQKKVDKSNSIGDCKILEDLWEKLMYMRIDQENPFPIDKSFRKQTIKYLEDLNSLVSQGVDNNLLKMYDKIYSHWVYFNSQIEFTIKSLNDENPYTKYFGILIPIERYEGNKPITKEESDISDLKVLTEWTKRFWKKGVEPMMNTNEIRTYIHNNITNYNKVFKE
jgi:flagellar biosynthesis GTPase FlhF